MTRILVVDDDEDTAECLMWMVRTKGWDVDTAYNGASAVRKVKAGGWDAVLMDIRMPKLYGSEAVQQMRAIDPNLPVVLFTGQAAPGDMLNALRSGAETCLYKPLTYEKVVTALTGAMARSHKGSSGAEPTPSTLAQDRKTEPLE
jgi:DNA-binding response OmpR family regulator